MCAHVLAEAAIIASGFRDLFLIVIAVSLLVQGPFALIWTAVAAVMAIYRRNWSGSSMPRWQYRCVTVAPIAILFGLAIIFWFVMFRA